LDDAETVTLTITRPDGTTVTPTVTSPPAVTGTYVYDYTPTVQGLHSVRWVFTGWNASAPLVDSFYVESSSLPPLISLAEARGQCRLSSTANDSDLQWMMLVASQMAEDHTQIWRRTTITDTLDGGGQRLQLRAPVASVTTVTESGTAVTASGYTLDRDLGILWRGSTTSRETWEDGRQNIAVTYVAGPSDGVVPATIRQGVRLEVQHLWDSQRGGSPTPRQAGADFAYDPRTGYSIPHAVIELWRSSMPGVLVA
jgi:hypothetical protein